MCKKIVECKRGHTKDVVYPRAHGCDTSGRARTCFLFKNTKICSILSELKLRTVIGRAREEEKEDKTIQALAGEL